MQQLQPPVALNHDTDSHCIPFDAVLEVLDFLPYADPLRVMFEMLFLTGCRLSELDNMRVSQIYDGVLYWRLGKNQKRFRKERLPEAYLRELRAYREAHRAFPDRLFGISHNTLRRFFNRDCRPFLSPRWREERLVGYQAELTREYVLQLKGLRKDFQTLTFAKQLEKWKDPGVALEFTSKKMRHSSEKITAHHYIENFEDLQIQKFGRLSPSEIIRQDRQLRILDYA